MYNRFVVHYLIKEKNNEKRGTRRKGSGERGTGNGETEKRRNGEQRRGNGEGRRKNGERDTRNGDQEPGTKHRERENENGKKPYTKAQSANHHPFSVLLHFSIPCFPFSLLVKPAPYKMNHQILLMVLFATRNEGVKQGNQCTDAFLFISSKTFLSYSLVLKSKGLVIYLVDW